MLSRKDFIYRSAMSVLPLSLAPAIVRCSENNVDAPDDAWIGNLPTFDATPAPARGIDPTRLPLHAGTATTIMITLSLDQLRADLATAEVIGASHLPGTDDPMTITAAEARRLACTANLIPAVLDSDSQPLDLGRTTRLFTTAQRHALQLRDRHCQAEGCLIPGTWCEAHHWNPWTHGGPTDLTNGLLLCRHHHTTAHDPTYTHDRHPTGTIRFHPRR